MQRIRFRGASIAAAAAADLRAVFSPRLDAAAFDFDSRRRCFLLFLLIRRLRRELCRSAGRRCYAARFFTPTGR